MANRNWENLWKACLCRVGFSCGRVVAVPSAGGSCLKELRQIVIIVEAHSTSVGNERGVASGHRDSPLSPLGITQAKELGERYRHVELSGVYCSDLRRSRRTAEVAFFGRRHLIRTDPRLRECDYGVFAGRSQVEIVATRALFVANPYPKGESYSEAVRRIGLFVHDLCCEESALHPVLIIGHRATQYGLECIARNREVADVVRESWEWQPGWVYMIAQQR